MRRLLPAGHHQLVAREQQYIEQGFHGRSRKYADAILDQQTQRCAALPYRKPSFDPALVWEVCSRRNCRIARYLEATEIDGLNRENSK